MVDNFQKYDIIKKKFINIPNFATVVAKFRCVKGDGSFWQFAIQIDLNLIQNSKQAQVYKPVLVYCDTAMTFHLFFCV